MEQFRISFDYISYEPEINIQNTKTWEIYTLDKHRILYYDNATEINAKSVDEDSRCQDKCAASREGVSR